MRASRLFGLIRACLGSSSVKLIVLLPLRLGARASPYRLSGFFPSLIGKTTFRAWNTSWTHAVVFEGQIGRSARRLQLSTMAESGNGGEIHDE
jgi:hypothetical protein